MGFFDNMKADRLGRKAYSVHLKADDSLNRGRKSDAQAKYAEARELYTQAYAAGCRKTPTLTAYAILMMRLGEFEQARELMREAGQDKTLSPDRRYNLRINYSICLWRLGILDEAAKTAEFAGKHMKNSSYYSALGTIMADQAKQTRSYDALKSFLDEAMDYDDEDPATLDNMGEMYRMMYEDALADGRVEDAAELRAKSVEYYEKALDEKPGQVTTLYALAQVAREDGDMKRAKELIDKAIVHSNSRVCPVTIEMLKAFRGELGA